MGVTLARGPRMGIIVVHIDAMREKYAVSNLYPVSGPNPGTFAHITVITYLDKPRPFEYEQFAGDPCEFANRNCVSAKLRVDDTARPKNSRTASSYASTPLASIPKRIETSSQPRPTQHAQKYFSGRALPLSFRTADEPLTHRVRI
jgi:hypothetical protein